MFLLLSLDKWRTVQLDGLLATERQPKEPGQPGGDPEWVAQGLWPVLSHTVINDLNEGRQGGRVCWTIKIQIFKDFKRFKVNTSKASPTAAAGWTAGDC